MEATLQRFQQVVVVSVEVNLLPELGKYFVWGQNTTGQLGQPPSEKIGEPVPFVVKGKTIKQLAPGHTHLAVLTQGIASFLRPYSQTTLFTCMVILARICPLATNQMYCKPVIL